MNINNDFKTYPVYNGHDLGARCSEAGTAFKLWAPTAESALLRLFRSGEDAEPYKTVPLSKQARGVWLWQSGENLDSVYYDYMVTVKGKARRTADPYARAADLSGERSMVLDFARTDPEGWVEDAPPPRQAEDIIYELHVKDFSWDERGGFPAEARGKYAAFACADTTLDGGGAHPTGLDYIAGLGVTHVQLMPVFDYDQLDESTPEGYNWGYDPLNYNVPEGSYSSDPARGEVRIRELKQLVLALHRRGLRVVMDVVYNHTSRRDSWLERTVPGYYYRHWPDGSWGDGSACGNDMASERPMARRYIVDSVLYWAEEYHMDGFRFDLMGLLDTETIAEVRAALDERYGSGEKLVYGEPWVAASTPAASGTALADKHALAAMDTETGAFCDATRDAIKGSAMDAENAGFVNGGAVAAETMLHCAEGWLDPWDDYRAAAPSQVITYVSAHDNHTLWDKLVLTMGDGKSFDKLSPELLKTNRLAAAIYCTCPGRLFLLGGEEFARTKQGCGNSYRSPSSLNMLDWGRAWQNEELVNYYRGIFALRKLLPALYDKSAARNKRLLEYKPLAERCVYFRLDDSPSSRWRELILVWNAETAAVPLALPKGKWQLLADGESSAHWQSPHAFACGCAPARSVLILGLSLEERQ